MHSTFLHAIPRGDSRCSRSVSLRFIGLVSAAVVTVATVGCAIDVDGTQTGDSSGESTSSSPSSSLQTHHSGKPRTPVSPRVSRRNKNKAAGIRFTVLRDFGLHSYHDALTHARFLTVKGRAPKTGYKRAQYGRSWDDNNDAPLGHNGCRTREDILQRDLVNVTFRPRTHGCVVETGVLHDPYTGDVVYFQHGQKTSALVQIDHVVALADSWVKGAQSWSADVRRAFANDPRNLLAVSGWVNAQKGSGDTATWLPPNKIYRCEYVARQVEVKRLYGLWVTKAEQAAMITVLQKCS